MKNGKLKEELRLLLKTLREDQRTMKNAQKEFQKTIEAKVDCRKLRHVDLCCKCKDNKGCVICNAYEQRYMEKIKLEKSFGEKCFESNDIILLGLMKAVETL